jgi:hypothetical protein
MRIGRVAERVIPLGLAFRVANKFPGELLLLGNTPVAGSNPAPTTNLRATKATGKELRNQEILGLLAGKL